MQAVDFKQLKVGDFVGYADVDPPTSLDPVQSGDPAAWFVMLTEPQQDLTTVWRLHELGLELYVPVVRRRVKTGRTGKNGVKLTRTIAKPMFPGYGFLRCVSVSGDNFSKIKDVRGVRDFLRNEGNKPVILPHQAVMAVFKEQMREHHEWLQQAGTRRGAKWKKGDMVRVDEDGGVYAGLVAKVTKVSSKGRIELLMGMIRHSLPGDMVVAV